MKKIHLFLIPLCLLLTGCSRLPEAAPGQTPDSGPPTVQESAAPSGTMQEDDRTEEAPPESPRPKTARRIRMRRLWLLWRMTSSRPP